MLVKSVLKMAHRPDQTAACEYAATAQFPASIGLFGGKYFLECCDRIRRPTPGSTYHYPKENSDSETSTC